MKNEIREIAGRIIDLREILDITPAMMAKELDMTETEYLAHENGDRDFSCSFLYKCANILNVDIVELLTGETAKLGAYSITRKGQGLQVKSRRKNFDYKYIAYNFKDKFVEPFMVTAPYFEEEQNQPIHLSSHESQEMDIVLKGSLKMEIDGHTFVLNKGDSVFYDSTKPHGMIATNGKDCEFVAIVIRGIEK